MCKFSVLLKFYIMNENIRAIYENGVLRPLRPLNFPEHSEVEIDVREIAENSAETHRDKVAGVLREAGLTTPIKRFTRNLTARFRWRKLKKI